MCFWQKFSENALNDFTNNGYTFSHMAKLNIITLVNKLDVSYDFCIKHNMHAVERKLNMNIARSPLLINSLNRFHKHPLIRKYSHIPFKLINVHIKKYK